MVSGTTPGLTVDSPDGMLNKDGLIYSTFKVNVERIFSKMGNDHVVFLPMLSVVFNCIF